nr:DUF1992 domain-containing protein [Dechloromonas sp.]
MIRLFDILAEQRIVDAIARGELDNLPGAGQPLVFDDDPLLSPEQRMLNRILKNAGFAPQAVLLRKEIADLRRQLDAAPEGAARDALRRELALALLRLAESG